MSGSKPFRESLAAYVERRNGIALGARGSLARNMRNALGASSNKQFWRHWNPIWGYYLQRWIYIPTQRWLPKSMSILLAFAVSGLVHDLAVGLVGKGWQLFFCVWFITMGGFLVISNALNLRYQNLRFSGRALLNLGSVALCLGIAWLLVY